MTQMRVKDSSQPHQNCPVCQQTSNISLFEKATSILIEHKDLDPSEVNREHRAVDKIHGNLTVLKEKDFNMITLAYIPNENVEQILNANYTEQKLYEEFVNVNERTNPWEYKHLDQKGWKQDVSVWKKGTTIKVRDN